MKNNTIKDIPENKNKKKKKSIKTDVLLENYQPITHALPKEKKRWQKSFC